MQEREVTPPEPYINLDQLFRQIEKHDWRAHHDHILPNNVAYMLLKELFDKPVSIMKMKAVMAALEVN